MISLRNFTLLLVSLLLTACSQSPQQQSNQSPPSKPQEPEQAQNNVSPSEKVIVSIGKTSPDVARLKPRFVEAFSPPRIKLQKDISSPLSSQSASQTQDELPPEGMKWLIVTIELDPAQGEVSIPINRIHLVDDSKRKYKLISFGGSDSSSFMDFREYEKYKMTEPPKLIIRSSVSSKQTMLFVIASNAAGLRLEM